MVIHTHKPNIIALIGPSGAGKSTLAESISATPNITFIRSVTTRPKRSASDTTHIFVNDDEFDQLLISGKFVDTYNGFGYRYGLPKSTDPNQLILIRVPLVEKLRQLYPGSIVVAVEAPISVLINRINSRGDTNRAKKSFLEKEILAGRKVADHIISTDESIEICTKQLEEIVGKL